MPAEIQSYRLTLRGKPVGTHTVTTVTQDQTTFMEGRFLLQNGLRPANIQQRSRFHSSEFFSYRFTEVSSGHGDNRTFDVTFNSQQGLVEARKGQDRASIPLLMPYRDPLSMLFELRRLEAGTESHRIPMLGKDVVARLVSDSTIDTGRGVRPAVTYALHPGASCLYLDQEYPHHILKLTQRLDDHFLEAILVKVAVEDAVPDWTMETPASGRPRTRRRKRRRRRRGGKGS